MIEDAIEKLLDRFENLLIRQQRTASSLLTKGESLTIPLEVVLEILRVNIAVLDAVYEIIEIIYDIDEDLREKAWLMCSEAISWASIVLMTLDKFAFLFLHHINIKGIPLLIALERLAKDMHKDYESLETLALQERIEDISKILKQQVEITIKSYRRVL